MAQVRQRAEMAQRFMQDEAFPVVMAEIRKGAIDAFLQTSGTQEDREEAHSLVVAAERFETILKGWIDEHTFNEQKKGQHRGTD